MLQRQSMLTKVITFYTKLTTPRDGMLILTQDGTCVKYNKDVNIDKVVVAIVKRYIYKQEHLYNRWIDH